MATTAFGGGSRLPVATGKPPSAADGLSPQGEGLPRVPPQIDDFGAAFTADPPAAPTPRPPADATLGEHALWLHAVGLRVCEDRPRGKEAAKHHATDLGHRNDAYAITAAWQRTPDANVAIRLGSTRAWDGEEPVYLVALDADGQTARAFVEAALASAGILDSTPCVEHGDGAKFFLRASFGTRSARLLVPGCRNEGHDGLELLASGKKATAYGVHPDGLPYMWSIEIPEDITAIPICPDSLLGLERKETRRGSSLLQDDLVVRQSGGRTWTVAELREEMIASGTDKVGSLFSPLRDDSKHSCFATLRGGSLCIHDVAEGTVYSDGIYEASFGGGGDHPAGKIGGLWGKRVTQSSRFLNLRPADWAIEGKAAMLVCLRSPIGTGKTTAISQIFADFRDFEGREPRVLAITYRQSLAKHLAGTWRLRSYLPLNEGGASAWKAAPAETLDRLAIQLDSLCTFGGRGKLADRLVETSLDEDGTPNPVKREWDFVVLDESESIFRHLHGGTLGDRSYGAWTTLRNILRNHAKTVILADALLSDYSLGEADRLLGGRPDASILVENTWKLGRNSVECEIFSTRDQESRKIRTSTAPRLAKAPSPEDAEHIAFSWLRAKKNVYLACTRKSEAARIARSAREAGIRTVLVTGDHDDPEGEQFLLDPDGYLAKCQPQVVVVTQAVESGFSIDSHYFDHVVLLGYGDSSTWQDLVQMSGRVRAPKSGLLAWVAERGPATWQQEAAYARALQHASAWTHTEIYPLMRTEMSEDEGVYVRAPHDSDHFQSHVGTVCHENRSRAALAEDFWNYWHYHNCEVIDLASRADVPLLGAAEISAARADKRAKRQQIKVEAAEALVAADSTKIDVDMAKKILDSAKADHDEKLSAHKVLVEDFYGRVADVDLALFDDHGKGRATVRKYDGARAVARGKRESLARRDHAEAKKGVSATERHELLAATLTWQILAAFGFSIEDIEGTAEKPHEVSKATPIPADLAEWLTKPEVRAQMRLHLGVDPRAFGFGGSTCSFRTENATSGSTDLPEDIDAALEAAEAAEPSSASGAPNVVGLVRAVLRRLGLRLARRRDLTRGKTRGTRYYSVDQGEAAKLVDLAGTHWQRLTGGEAEDGVAAGVVPAGVGAELGRLVEEEFGSSSAWAAAPPC